MTEALRLDRVIAGAYSDKHGGVCPMLGAHRRGGRTDYAEFALAWDAFTGAKEARPATELELLALRKCLAYARLEDEQRAARAAAAERERAAAAERARVATQDATPRRVPQVRTFRFRRRPRVQGLERALRRLAVS